MDPYVVVAHLPSGLLPKRSPDLSRLLQPMIAALAHLIAGVHTLQLLGHDPGA